LDDDLGISPRKAISREAIESSATNLVPAGSVVVATRVGLGKVGIAATDLCFSQDCQGLILDQNVCDTKFVAHQLKLRVQTFKHISRGTTIAGVTKKQLLDVSFDLPPVPQQRRIVAEIEKQFARLEAGVAALRRVQANLKRYRAAVLKAACEGRLVPTEAELHRKQKTKTVKLETGAELLARILTERRQNWQGRGKHKEPDAPDTAKLSPLPEGWAWASAEQLTSLVTSGSRGWGEFYSDAGPLFIRAQDIKTDSLKLDGVARVTLPAKAEGMRSSVENGDLLITITGANVTKSAIVHGLSELAFVSQHVALLKPVCRETASFQFFWIVSPAHGRKLLEKWAYGAGKPGLSLEQVRSLPIALPPLAEQTRIVAEVERRLSVVEELETVVTANLQRATRLRQSILQKAFTGELVIKGNQS
jgi:type I restriction enzyme S subunit